MRRINNILSIRPSTKKLTEFLNKHVRLLAPPILLCIIHNMNSRNIIKMLETDGWVLKRVRGSHHHYTHPTKSGVVTVPHPKKDLPAGTVNSIKKQAGLK